MDPRPVVAQSEPYEMAMFPLGRVLFPSVVLPLHIFEPRYRDLFSSLVEASADDEHAAEFGVVLIERGSEVGGGEVRSGVGTVARVIQAEQTPDGRWGVVAVGVRRCRIVEWLDDDPWPRAMITDWPDTGPPGDTDRYAAAISELRRTLAMATELGDPAAASTVELSDDSDLGSFQLAALAPIGPADQQRLLMVDGATERIDAVHALLVDQIEVLEQRLVFDDHRDPPDEPR